LSSIEREKDIFWIDLVSPSVEEDKIVETFLGISIPTRQDMEEIELSSQFYEEDGARYMTLSVIAQMHIDNPVKTPVTFILYQNALVTIRYEELVSLNNYVTKAGKKGGVNVAAPEAVMCDILESLINRIADSLELVGRDIETISRDIFRSKKTSPSRKNGILQSSIRKIGAEGDLLGMLRESLASFGRFVSHYNFDYGRTETKAVRSKFNTIHKDVQSLSDHANFLSGKMNFLLDATLGMINLEQNQIIKIFSVVAVVFLPPTMVATIYGMNFKTMPELEWAYGYPLSIAFMIAFAVLPLLYFKKKGWL
jgi:magnesium transporter